MKDAFVKAEKHSDGYSVELQGSGHDIIYLISGMIFNFSQKSNISTDKIIEKITFGVQAHKITTALNKDKTGTIKNLIDELLK